MNGNPFLGLIFHWLGGLASASFYIPYRGVKRWSWETYWLVGGVFSWIVAPWILAGILVPGVLSVLSAAPADSIWKAYLCGAVWGIGGLTFGLTMRYLGIALGMAVALGLCTAFGTLIPPIVDGQMQALISSTPFQVVLAGIGLCMLGIAISGAAGMSKEREMTDAQKKAVIKEFNFTKGILIATFSGVLSSFMAFGLNAGEPIKQLAKAHLAGQGATDLWQGLPVLVVVLAGGFTSNFIWCMILNRRNGSGREYFSGLQVKPGNESAVDSHGNAIPSTAPTAGSPTARHRVPLLMNYFLSAVAGVTWYLQFFFYSMGEPLMGQYKFSSWTLHMASIIIFSTLWGVGLGEWKGSSRRTKILVVLGLAVLVGSTVVVGWGNSLKDGGGVAAGH